MKTRNATTTVTHGARGAPSEDFLDHGAYIRQILPVVKGGHAIMTNYLVNLCLGLAHDFRKH